LAAIASQSDQADPVVRAALQQRLTRWRLDKDFASLRNPDALDELTANEREECLALWRDADSLLDRPRTAKP